MKKIVLLFMCFFFLLGCQEKEYSLKNLEQKEGLSYLKGGVEPYTGQTIERLGKEIIAINVFEKGDQILGTTFYPNGNKEYEIQFKNGKENGYWRQYFYNGQLDYETYKVDGIVNGMTKSYYEDGQLKSEKNYVDNKIIGDVLSYYESGQIKTKFDSLGNGFTYFEDGRVRSKIENEKEVTFL